MKIRLLFLPPWFSVRVLAVIWLSLIFIPVLQAQQPYRNFEPVESAAPGGQGSYAPAFLQTGGTSNAPATNTPAAVDSSYVERASYNEAIRNRTTRNEATGDPAVLTLIVPPAFQNQPLTQSAVQTNHPGSDRATALQNTDSQFDSSQQHPSASAAGEPLVDFLADQAGKLTEREGTGSSIKIALLLTALSLAPAVVLMTTCYVRVVVVLSLLRQAFGARQLPPTQVLTALSLFITILVMAPVWNEIKKEAIDPYANSQEIDWQEAWDRGIVPVRSFMSRQIEAAGNGDTIAMLYKYAPSADGRIPQDYDDVPLNVLLPSFMISELKIAFLLGFQIYLPFLIVDLVVSSVTVSMGMLMLPPTMVSFPMKLILFVMVDGWALVVGMLLQSFAPYT